MSFGDRGTVTGLWAGAGGGGGRGSHVGLLLLSGTGALAAGFSGGALHRRCDGYGWLLGAEGSAVWIGLRAMRTAVAAVDGHGEPTALLAAARRWADEDRPAGDDLAQHLVAAGFARPPAALGGQAPAVGAAAAKLLHTFDTVGAYAGDVVLAGSVLLSPGPVARVVRAGVRERTGTQPREALDGAGGAAVLALARLTGDRVPAAVHARLTGHDRRRRRSG
ncbi:hypothetical protein COUCH_19445 [Couchioplanes caeruleus]|uniref:hypothetical protein n=1 Tax=Couchioplanes caeruleus TaxID=56438 RepID=UPI0020C14713|nr:hypothetical protein [Couchioplanes caeruleus]UQU61245.1 hypothetical protein COUCH_19445 [Couchioplanes caeruleus]